MSSYMLNIKIAIFTGVYFENNKAQFDKDGQQTMIMICFVYKIGSACKTLYMRIKGYCTPD